MSNIIALNGSSLHQLSLEHLSEKLSIELNGEQGSNRELTHHCQIKAKNDYQALQCWLNEYRLKKTTWRTYQKEAERFLLWAVLQREKPLSSLGRDDIEAYIQFLDNPEPKDKWCGKYGGRSCRRGDPSWRPFTGPLSQSAKKTAISCIDSLFNYLVHARYLAFNPLSLIRKRDFSTQQIKNINFSLEERILTAREWHAMLATLDEWPQASGSERAEKERLKFLIKILYFLGLRINELTTHTWNAFREVDDNWWFYVLGKGDKLGRIPVNDELLRAIIIYRTYLKLSHYPTTDETRPLIPSLTTGSAITPRQINKLLKKLALKTLLKFEHEPNCAKKLKKFSAHWLRHLSASMQDKAGIAFKHIRANHRHENDETTRRYVHALDEERHADMQKLRLK